MPGLIGAWRSGQLRLGVEPLQGLASDCGDYVEVLIQVQDREARQLGGCRDDQVRDGRSAVLATVGQQRQDFHRPVLNADLIVEIAPHAA
jgi:hypothetical protein